MAAVDPCEGSVVHRLQTELQPKIGLFRKRADQIERVVGKAIGSRRNRQAHHAREIQGLAIKRGQLRRGVVGVRITLKICDKLFRFVALPNCASAVNQLFRHRCARTIALRRMARVIAVDAAADSDTAVAIGASEIEPQADFIDARAERFLERSVVRVEALAAPVISQ